MAAICHPRSPAKTQIARGTKAKTKAFTKGNSHFDWFKRALLAARFVICPALLLFNDRRISREPA
jgi:hypothetical protein